MSMLGQTKPMGRCSNAITHHSPPRMNSNLRKTFGIKKLRMSLTQAKWFLLVHSFMVSVRSIMHVVSWKTHLHILSKHVKMQTSLCARPKGELNEDKLSVFASVNHLMNDNVKSWANQYKTLKTASHWAIISFGNCFVSDAIPETAYCTQPVCCLILIINQTVSRHWSLKYLPGIARHSGWLKLYCMCNALDVTVVKRGKASLQLTYQGYRVRYEKNLFSPFPVLFPLWCYTRKPQ